MSSVHEGKKPIDGKKSFKCDICRASYNHEDELIGHMISIHDGKKSFKCDNLNSGNKAESKITKEPINLAAATSEISQSNSDVEIHGFNSDAEVDSRPLLSQTNEVHEGKGTNKKRPAEEESTKKQKKIRKVHNILCCGKVYSRLDYYKDHKKRAHEGVTHKCDICEEAFKWKSYLSQHKKTVHGGLRPLKCGYCELTFKTTSNLNRHVRLKHA